jgi:hypothetical protein
MKQLFSYIPLLKVNSLIAQSLVLGNRLHKTTKKRVISYL